MWEHSLHLNVKFIRSLKIYLENIKDKINSLLLCIEMCISPIAGSVVKNLPALQDWRRQWHPTPVLLPGEPHGRRSLVGCGPWGREESGTTERLHFHFHALEKEMATHSRVLAWRIPGMGEPGGLLSMGSHRVRHDWSDLAAVAVQDTWVQSLGWEDPLKKGIGYPLQYSCLKNSMNRGAWWATVHRVAKSRTQLSD